MDDLISRQAAIDAPERFIKDCNPEHFVGHQKFIEYMDDAEIGSFGNWQFANGFNMGLTATEVAIEKLPPAYPLNPCETCLHKGKGWDEDPCDGCTGAESKYEPDNGWIPVGERLPVYGEKCLVDFKLMSGTSHCISTSYCYVQKEGFWSDTPFQYKAIAWMPLPDPYKEEEQ